MRTVSILEQVYTFLLNLKLCQLGSKSNIGSGKL